MHGQRACQHTTPSSCTHTWRDAFINEGTHSHSHSHDTNWSWLTLHMAINNAVFIIFVRNIACLWLQKSRFPLIRFDMDLVVVVFLLFCVESYFVVKNEINRKVIFSELNSSVSDTNIFARTHTKMCVIRKPKKAAKTLSVYVPKWNRKVVATMRQPKGWTIENGGRNGVRVEEKVKTFALIGSYIDFARQSVQCQKVHFVWMKCMIVCDVCSVERAHTVQNRAMKSSPEQKKGNTMLSVSVCSVLCMASDSFVTPNYLHSILNDVHAYANQALQFFLCQTLSLSLCVSLVLQFLISVTNSNL